MREQRGKQAAASFLFKLAESVGTQGISFVVSVVLAVCAARWSAADALLAPVITAC